MPGIIVHTLLGTRLLNRWQAEPQAAPFPAADPALRNVFLAGCMGPDMGMFPGGAALFSDLAHYVRSGELARALLRRANTDRQRAFAWGWASHVLADAMIHPLVNVGAGELRGGGPLTYADDPAAHLAVEVGIDGWQLTRWTDHPQLRGLVLPLELAEFIAEAYREVHGPAINGNAVRRSLRAWAKWHGFSVAAAGGAAAQLYGASSGRHGFHGFARVTVKWFTGTLARRWLLHAITHPVASSARVESRVVCALEEFAERFREQERNQWDSLPDYNLDTGEVEQTPTYPLTVKTLALRGNGPIR